jgi:hypothetical protein
MGYLKEHNLTFALPVSSTLRLLISDNEQLILLYIIG